MIVLMPEDAWDHPFCTILHSYVLFYKKDVAHYETFAFSEQNSMAYTGFLSPGILINVQLTECQKFILIENILYFKQYTL